MSPEIIPNKKLGEARKKYTRDWSMIESRLPDGIDPQYLAFLKGYFRAQLRVAKGQTGRAKEIFDNLDGKEGYKEFTTNNQPLLAAIDLAVRGENRRKIEPAFVIRKS